MMTQAVLLDQTAAKFDQEAIRVMYTADSALSSTRAQNLRDEAANLRMRAAMTA